MEQMLIRAPESLKKAIRAEAKKRGITLNALLLQILWQWMEGKEQRK